MDTLEQLLTDLGISEHIEVISNYRDSLLIEKAAELQTVHADHADAVDAINVQHSAKLLELDSEISGLKAELSIKATGIDSLKEDLVSANDEITRKITQISTLQSSLSASNSANQAKTAEISRLNALLAAPEKERRRLELEAELAALKAEDAPPEE